MNEDHALLEALRGQLAALNALLVDEGRTLQGNRPEHLPEVTQHKEQLFASVARTWNTLARRHGAPLGASRESLSQALAAKLPDESLTLWHEALALAEVADKQNQLNGKLIEEQLRRTQSALEILRSFSSKPNLYGADGRSEGLFSSTHIIDKA